MNIKKIKINNFREVRITKDNVNGNSFIQVREWNKKDNRFRPTNRYIALNEKYLPGLINGLELGNYLESDIYGRG